MQCRFAVVLCAAAGLADATDLRASVFDGSNMPVAEALAPPRLQVDAPAVEAMH